MKKTWALSLCVAGAIAITACGASSASPAPRLEDNRPSFTVFTHMIEAHVVSPCPTCATPTLAVGSGVRTEYVNDPVFDQQTDGTQIGQEALIIDIVSSDGSTALLSGALNLTGGTWGRGQITVSGEIDARTSSGVVTITGGTGAFHGAVGEVDYSGAGLSSKVTTLEVRLAH